MQDFGALAQEVSPTYAYTYYAHAVIGFGAAAMGVVALVSRKGGAWHRRAGQVFLIAMGFAALSALYFVITRIPAPPIIISALAAIYGMGMAILSLRPQTGLWFIVQAATAALPILIGLFYFSYIAAAIFLPDIPAYIGALGPMAGLVFLAIGWKDIEFLRSRDVDRVRRLRRHGLRMAIVCAEVVRAPLQSFGPPFLGEEHSFQFYAFAPMLLIPVFYFVARPNWLKPQASAPTSAQAPA
ncbi:MAG: hypothetical protein AAF650_09635 [Pseudomonadota bacterium]